jgi:ribosomal protein S4
MFIASFSLRNKQENKMARQYYDKQLRHKQATTAAKTSTNMIM